MSDGSNIKNRAFSGRKLRERRLEIKQQTDGKKGSQSWLAYTIGAHVTSISDWERGDNTPTARHLNALAQVFGCEMDELFEDDEDEEDETAVLRRVVHQLVDLGYEEMAAEVLGVVLALGRRRATERPRLDDDLLVQAQQAKARSQERVT